MPADARERDCGGSIAIQDPRIRLRLSGSRKRGSDSSSATERLMERARRLPLSSLVSLVRPKRLLVSPVEPSSPLAPPTGTGHRTHPVLDARETPKSHGHCAERGFSTQKARHTQHPGPHPRPAASPNRRGQKYRNNVFGLRRVVCVVV